MCNFSTFPGNLVKEKRSPQFSHQVSFVHILCPYGLKVKTRNRQRHNKFQKILGRHLIHCQFSKEVVWCPLVHKHILQIKPKPKFFFTKPQVSDFYLFVWLVGWLDSWFVEQNKAPQLYFAFNKSNKAIRHHWIMFMMQTHISFLFHRLLAKIPPPKDEFSLHLEHRILKLR